MNHVDATNLIVCPECKRLFPAEDGYNNTHCSEECCLGLGRGSIHDLEDDRDDETDLCPGDYHCVYPVPNANLSLLPEDWRYEARHILTNWRALGPQFQGCCCGYEHRALSRREVRELRAGGFLVLVVFEDEPGCQPRPGSNSYEYDDMGYDPDDIVDYGSDEEWNPGLGHFGSDPSTDLEIAEDLKARYLAGENLESTDYYSYPPDDIDDYMEEEEALEDMGYHLPPYEPEFVFLDDPTVLPRDSTLAAYEPLESPVEMLGVFQIRHLPMNRRPYVVSHRFGGKVWNTLTWNDLVDEETFFLREEAVRYINTLMRHLNPQWVDAN